MTSFLLLGFMGVAWGATFSLAKIATDGGAHPIGLAFLQAVGGALLFSAACLMLRKPLPVSPSHLMFYVVCGLLGSGVPGVLFFYAARHVPAGILAITIALVPLMTYGLSWLLRIDPLSLRRIVGILCGFAAMALIVAPEASLPSPAMAPWVLLTVVCAACYAVEAVYIALRRPAGTDSIAAVAGMFWAASALLLPLVLATGTIVTLPLPWGEVEWAIVGMVVLSALAYGTYFHVVDAYGPVFASQTGYIVTIAGVFWGIAIFGERHSPWIWASLLIMIAGLALVTPRRAVRPA